MCLGPLQVRPEMLVCLDPGEPPAGLPKLTLVEQLCLAPIRPFRHMVVLKPTGAGNRTLPHDSLHRALVGVRAMHAVCPFWRTYVLTL